MSIPTNRVIARLAEITELHDRVIRNDPAAEMARLVAEHDSIPALVEALTDVLTQCAALVADDGDDDQAWTRRDNGNDISDSISMILTTYSRRTDHN
jgi:hypothetical protein